MLVYYLNLTLILGLGWLLCRNNQTGKRKAIYLSVTFGFMLLLCALRQNIGNDYDSYLSIYSEAGTTALLEPMSTPIEMGYRVLCKLLFSMGLSGAWMYLVMGVLCLAPVAWFIGRYSKNVWLSTWLYVTLTFFYGTMNFIRQNLALSVLLLGYPLLRQKRLLPRLLYLPVILLACSFHKTAIVMLPILLLCAFPLTKPLALFYGGAALLLYFTSRQILDFVTQYVFSSYRGSIYLEVGFGLHFLIVPTLIFLFVVAIPWVRRTVIQNNPDGLLLVNMVLYSTLIWLFITRHFVLERFSLYVYIYAILAIPAALETLVPDQASVERLNALRGQRPHGKAQKGKVQAVTQLQDAVTGQQVLYYAALVGILVVTLCYNIFGMYDGESGFHGVFPYQSMIDAITRLP